MHEPRHQKLTPVPASVTVTGKPKVFPYPVEYEDDGISSLAVSIRTMGTHNITSITWHGDSVVTGPVVNPGTTRDAFAAAVAAAVAAGFTARVSGYTVYFTRDDGERVGGYGAATIVTTGTSVVVDSIVVRMVIQDMRATSALLQDLRVAIASDPDGTTSYDTVMRAACTESNFLDFAAYSVHTIAASNDCIGGVRGTSLDTWGMTKKIVEVFPATSTRDVATMALLTGLTDEWGEDHPLLPIPEFMASGRVVNLDGAANAFVDGNAILPGDEFFFTRITHPIIVTPSTAGCRVEWQYHFDK